MRNLYLAVVVVCALVIGLASIVLKGALYTGTCVGVVLASLCIMGAAGIGFAIIAAWEREDRR